MKYFVNVGDREIEVVVDGERVTVAGRTVVVHRTGIVGTPLHQVMIDGRPLLLPLERLGAGRWSVTAWGERRDATVQDERAKQIEGLVRKAEPADPGRGGQGADAGPGAPDPGIGGAGGGRGPGGAGAGGHEDGERDQGRRRRAWWSGSRSQPGQAVEKGQVLLQMGPVPGA